MRCSVAGLNLRVSTNSTRILPMPKRSKPRQPKAPTQQSQSTAASDGGNTAPIPTKTPRFAEPPPTPDPTKFTVKHGSDAKAYKILDSLKGTLQPRPFPVVSGTDGRSSDSKKYTEPVRVPRSFVRSKQRD